MHYMTFYHVSSKGTLWKETSPQHPLIVFAEPFSPPPLPHMRTSCPPHDHVQGPAGCVAPELAWRREPDGYLKQILTARVYRIAVETPLQAAPMLSKALGSTILLKREDMQARGTSAVFVHTQF
jgi:hypothetical protein